MVNFQLVWEGHLNTFMTRFVELVCRSLRRKSCFRVKVSRDAVWSRWEIPRRFHKLTAELFHSFQALSSLKPDTESVFVCEWKHHSFHMCSLQTPVSSLRCYVSLHSGVRSCKMLLFFLQTASLPFNFLRLFVCFSNMWLPATMPQCKHKVWIMSQ